MSSPSTGESRAPTPADADPNLSQSATDDQRDSSATAASDAASPASSVWRGVLRHTHYRRVLFAQVFSNIGTWTEMFAIQMFVAQKTGRLDDQGTLAVCQLLPICILGILGGLAADRVNRRTLLVVSQLLAGVVALGVAMVVSVKFPEARTAINWLFVLGVLNGCVMAFNFPAWQVLTPRLVPREDLSRAITVNGIQFNAARVVGPAIAGVVLAQWGAPPLLWFNAVTFLVMAAVVMTTPDDPAPAKAEAGVWDRVLEAWKFLMHNRGPRAVFLSQFTLCMLAAPMVRMLSNFVIDVYGLGETDVAAAAARFVASGGVEVSSDVAKHLAAEAAGGTILAVQGIGAVTGGLCLRFVPKWYPKHHFIPLSVAGLGLSITAFGLTRTVWSGYIAMAVCGWFWMWAFNQSWASLQVLTPDRLRGLVMSVTNVAVFGAMALGGFLAGFGGEQLKRHGVLDAAAATQASILMLSIPLACAGGVMMIFRTPEVDGMPREGANPRVARSLFHAITAKEHWPSQGGMPKRTDTIEAIQEQEPI